MENKDFIDGQNNGLILGLSLGVTDISDTLEEIIKRTGLGLGAGISLGVGKVMPMKRMVLGLGASISLGVGKVMPMYSGIEEVIQ